MTILLLRVSGVHLLEKNIAERRRLPRYVLRTNAFIRGCRAGVAVSDSRKMRARCGRLDVHGAATIRRNGGSASCLTTPRSASIDSASQSRVTNSRW